MVYSVQTSEDVVASADDFIHRLFTQRLVLSNPPSYLWEYTTASCSLDHGTLPGIYEIPMVQET
jgi:hypothetical protein